jgi:alpha-glucosidase
MGAFISTYGASEFPNSFRKIGSFSPAYWFAMPELNNYLSSTPNLLNHRIYFVAGKNESSSMVQNITTIRTIMQNNGLSSANTLLRLMLMAPLLKTIGGVNLVQLTSGCL